MKKCLEGVINMLYANVTFFGGKEEESKGILFINNVCSMFLDKAYTEVDVGRDKCYHVKETPEEILKNIKKLEV